MVDGGWKIEQAATPGVEEAGQGEEEEGEGEDELFDRVALVVLDDDGEAEGNIDSVSEFFGHN